MLYVKERNGKTVLIGPSLSGANTFVEVTSDVTYEPCRCVIGTCIRKTHEQYQYAIRQALAFLSAWSTSSSKSSSSSWLPSVLVKDVAKLIAKFVVEPTRPCMSRCLPFHTGLEQHFGLNQSEMVKAVGAIITGSSQGRRIIVLSSPAVTYLWLTLQEMFQTSIIIDHYGYSPCRRDRTTVSISTFAPSYSDCVAIIRHTRLAQGKLFQNAAVYNWCIRAAQSVRLNPCGSIRAAQSVA